MKSGVTCVFKTMSFESGKESGGERGGKKERERKRERERDREEMNSRTGKIAK